MSRTVALRLSAGILATLGAWSANTQTALTVQQLKNDLYLIEVHRMALPTPATSPST